MWKKKCRTAFVFLALLCDYLGATAQVTEGFYYIVSNQDQTYYLCPAQDPANPAVGYWVDGNLMLTTKKEPPTSHAVWRIVPGTGDAADTWFGITYTSTYYKISKARR